MENNGMNLEAFSQLIKSEQEFCKAWAAYREAVTVMRNIVDDIEERQQNEAKKIAGMLAELEAEEAQLRRAAQNQAQERAKRSLRGESVPGFDLEIGARLATLPDEKAALEALRARKEITDEERERYEEALEIAQGAADATGKAVTQHRKEAEAALALVNAARGRLNEFSSIPRPFSSISDLQNRVYRLNTVESEPDIAYETPYGILRGGYKI